MNEELLKSEGTCDLCHKKVTHKRLTLSYLLSDALSNLFNLERGLVFTLRELIVRPGEVTNAFVSGDRYRYMNPFRLLITVVALVVLASSWVDLDMADMMVTQNGARSEEMTQLMREAFRKYLNVILLLNIPFMTVGSILIFRRQRWNFAEHLALNSYAYSVVALLTTVVSLIAAPFPTDVEKAINGVGGLLYLHVAFVYAKTWNIKWYRAILWFLLSFFFAGIVTALLVAGTAVVYNKVF